MNRLLKTVLTIALAAGLLVPSGAFAQSLQEAAQQAARQHDAKVLSARTEVRNNGQRIHHIKLLTKDGRVKTVRVPDRRSKARPDRL